MNLEVQKCGDFLVVLLNVFDPATGVAVTPTSATATFYVYDGANIVVSLSLAQINLAQVDAVVGLFGGVADATGVEVRNLIVVVEAVVAATNQTAIKVLGSTLTKGSLSVGGPSITITPGPAVGNAEGPGV